MTDHEGDPAAYLSEDERLRLTTSFYDSSRGNEQIQAAQLGIDGGDAISIVLKRVRENGGRYPLQSSVDNDSSRD